MICFCDLGLRYQKLKQKKIDKLGFIKKKCSASKNTIQKVKRARNGIKLYLQHRNILTSQ